MKKYLIILFLLISPLIGATNYHFSNDGNDDTGNGSIAAPYATITKLNALWAAGTFAPDDTIFFNKGDTFTGTLVAKESGTSGHPIVISAYGIGDNPIITGFTTLSSWTDEGGGIYSKTVTCESPPEMVTIDGTQYARGRWPNSPTWATIDSHVGVISITDADLNDSLVDWAGAEVVIRTSVLNNIQRFTIIDHNNQTITYSGGNSYPVADEYGYFIQNDLKTLDSFGEWYYNDTTSTFYVFFGDKNPNDYHVKVSTLDKVVDVGIYNDYIVFENLSIHGGNKNSIFVWLDDYITIQSCEIDFSGNHGITANRSENLKILSNLITNCNDCAISIATYCHNAIINGNTIENTGLMPGMGLAEWASGKAMLLIQSNNLLIENNRILNSGFSGINFSGINTKVSSNLINTFNVIKEDGGGIQYGSQAEGTEMIVSNNLVINGMESLGGKPLGSKHMTYGIYFDYYSSGFDILDNTVANCKSAGILISGSQNSNVKNNTIYNCFNAIQLQELSGLGSPPRNITMNENIFFAKDISQAAMQVNSTTNDFNLFGLFNNNCYARPIDDVNTIDILINWGGIGRKTLEYWQNTYEQDLQSFKSPISVADTTEIDFYYNATSSPDTKILPYASIDLTGTKYATEYEVPAWSGVVLLKDPDPDARPITSGGKPIVSGGQILTVH